MKLSRHTLAILAIAVVASGCASKMLDDDRLRTYTAPLIGARASDVTIHDRTEQGTNTYYTAKTSGGAEYSCSVNGGGIMAAGMLQGGNCVKKPEGAKAGVTTRVEPVAPFTSAPATPAPKAAAPAKKAVKK